MHRSSLPLLGLALVASLSLRSQPTASPEVVPSRTSTPSLLQPAPVTSGTLYSTPAPEWNVRDAFHAAEAIAQPAWRPRELLVQASQDADFAELARDAGVTVVQPPGPSGVGVVQVPEDVSVEAALATLHQTGGVVHVGRHGAIYGAWSSNSWSSSSWSSTSLWSVLSTWGAEPQTELDPSVDPVGPRALQWHLNDINTVDSDTLSDFVVAVLDSGVSYGLTESLSSVPITAPLDLVDDDLVADDEHWHGTHIASLIASDGEVHGAARGVGLMPVRVLDENNAGAEIDLIDGIYHAVDNGADVINMSLAFSPGYAPSPALLEALEVAADAGVVMVGAA
ncbi:MAG: S8 family serine peptidase, partial [Myxococcota bacterium]